MKITIVTPCFNMQEYIGETLRSIACQKFVDLEYLVLDGVSTDGSWGIIQGYADKSTRIFREKDDGQYHAIQKGFERSSGELMGWLNADDIYMPWTLRVVEKIFSQFPEIEWITGLPTFLNSDGECTSIHAKLATYPRKFVRNGWFRGNLGGYLQQESMFWRRSLWDKVGGFDPGLKLAADFKLWTDFAKHADLVPVNIPLAAFRQRPGMQRSSTQKEQYEEEVASVCSDYPDAPWLWRFFADKGVIARSLCRSLIRGRSDCLAYCATSQRWQKVSSVRTVSRVNLSRLILEHKLSTKP